MYVFSQALITVPLEKVNWKILYNFLKVIIKVRIKAMIVYFRLLKESFSFAMNALRNNKLRTLLSLLGVTIGIFSIIAVLAAVD